MEAEIFENQAAAVTAGLPVTMTLGFLPGKLWQGRVDYVYPTLDVKTRTIKVRLRFDNDSGELKPNMFARVAIHAKSNDDTLLVPKEAVVRTGSVDRVVLALGEGRYKSVEVKLGRSGEDNTEILMGVEAGERVVTSAQFLLDSESSKTSDFKRMNHPDDNVANALAKDSVWAEAEINSVIVNRRMINVSHDAIGLWNWPAMTMDFIVASDVDMSQLQPGTKLKIEIQNNADNTYEVINVRPADNAYSDSATVEGVINSIMVDHRMINISRGPIVKWNRPAATVDFLVDSSVDMSILSESMKVQFSFNVSEGEFTITDIKASDIQPIGASSHQQH